MTYTHAHFHILFFPFTLSLQSYLLSVQQEVDALRLRDEVEAAGHLLQEIEDRIPEDQRHNFLWRLARATFDRSEREPSMKKDLLLQARRMAEEAVSRSPTCADAHKWLAITTGAYAEFETLKGKLDCGQRFRQEINEAIRLNPKDPSSHYLLGRWCLEVYIYMCVCVFA